MPCMCGGCEQCFYDQGRQEPEDFVDCVHCGDNGCEWCDHDAAREAEMEAKEYNAPISLVGNGIQFYRLVALASRLKLEIKGLKFRGGSTYAYIKREFGFKGNREKVLKQLEEYIENWKKENPYNGDV